MQPPSVMASVICHFSRSIFSCEPSCSIWLTPIFVITAALRESRVERRFISPFSLIPISITAASSSGAIFIIVTGTPIWLLAFPAVLNTLSPPDRAQAIISLVVVFPTLPVTPTLLSESLLSYSFAVSCIALTESSASTIGLGCIPKLLHLSIRPATASSFCVKDADAPQSKALSMYLCPSTRSPTIGANISPGSALPELVAKLSICTFSSPQSRLPPTALTISLTQKSFILIKFLT